ncbi:MAG TPA: peptidase S8/S53 subtilisin kexin sedolisin, partial [Thauera aminoaromatica]|nr:peptidase S8/S53 subtilisin kexin sedolisin [Thauera aminoaromatica]
ALLIHGARAVHRRDGQGEEDRQRAGFGRLWLAGSLPGPDGPVLIEDRVGVATGERRRIDCTGPGRLRAVLCWYDAPGEALINDLDLVLCDAGGSVLAWGNHPAGAVGSPDRRNTVECIDVALGEGEWMLEVRGVNVPLGLQPWALATSPGVVVRATPAAPGTPTVPADPLPAPRWRVDLPWTAVRGVGARRAIELERTLPGGLATLCAGVPDEDALAFLPAALRAQIRSVAAFLGAPPPAAARLALAHPLHALLSGAPETVSTVAWQALAAALSPLLEALDRNVAREVRGERLFR